MVTTIDPVVHGDRKWRYAATLSLHVFGATASAAAFGAFLGLVGALLGGPWDRGGLVTIALIAGLYALREAAGLPIPIPDRHRQVPEWWRTFYPPPVAALLYGLGLGIGFLTFLTFGTFVAVALGAIASGNAALGAVICGAFGLARGLSILLATRRGGAAALDLLDRIGATRGPRLINAAALIAVAALAVVATV